MGRISLGTLTATVLSLTFLVGVAGAGETNPAADLLDRFDELDRALREQIEANQALRAEIGTLRDRVKQLESKGELKRTQGTEVVPAKSETTGTTIPAGFRVPTDEDDNGGGLLTGIFDKPFLEDNERQTTVGGYVDLEYRDSEDSNRTFRQHRFVPFIYSQLTDQIRFAAEIEFEDGGTDTAAGDGETKVEFATVDYMPSEAFGIRAGAILVPLGRFNLYHDSPVNDLTDRPMVTRAVIPTTFTEAGAGFFGTVYPGEESKLDYEVYLVNGFNGLETDSTGMSPTGFVSNFDTSSGVRGGRGSLKSDNNNSVAGVGRLGFSPFLGLEVGGSTHIGKYDEKGDNELWIYAVDAHFQPGSIWEDLHAFEIIGELARAEIERNNLARASGVPDDLWGIYGQVNYHFMPECLREKAPKIFLEESTFTLVFRMEHLELDDTRTERGTIGINFRPIEETVFKFDYQINWEDWSHNRVRNDTFLFSLASYF